MVNVDYNQTAFSFKKGVKEPKGVYAIFIGTSCSVILCGLFLIVVVFALDEYDESSDAVGGGIFIILFGLSFLIFALSVMLHEKLVIKKAIMECIQAGDAIMRTAFVFEVGFESAGIIRKASKVGVRFTYGNKKVLMVRKKYAILRSYVDKECRIVYSASCDDVVLLKAEKDRRTCKEK